MPSPFRIHESTVQILGKHWTFEPVNGYDIGIAFQRLGSGPFFYITFSGFFIFNFTIYKAMLLITIDKYSIIVKLSPN